MSKKKGKNKGNFTRRQFLKTAGATTAAVGASVGFTHQLVGLLLVGVAIRKGDRRAELGDVTRPFRRVDDFRAADLVFQLGDPALDETLAFTRGMVLGVFRQVAMLTCVGDGSDHRRPLFRFERFQLFLQPLEALQGNGYPLHHDHQFA